MDEVNKGINIITQEREVRGVMYPEPTRRSIKIRTLRGITRIMGPIGIRGIWVREQE